MNVLDSYAKRFSLIGKVVMSTKLVQRQAMTRNCDVVIMLHPSRDDSKIQVTLADGTVCSSSSAECIADDGSGKRSGFMQWLFDFICINHPELTCTYRWHLYTRIPGIYVTASYDKLLRGTEALHLRKRLKAKYGHQYREFVYDERNLYENVDGENGEFLVSSERQAILRYALNHARVPQSITIRTPNKSITISPDELLLPALEHHDLVTIFPLHLHNNTESTNELRAEVSSQSVPTRVNLEWLCTNWVETVWRRQPLDAVKEYFGVKIAIYFAWIGHYTVALILPALLGFLTWICFDTPLRNAAFASKNRTAIANDSLSDLEATQSVSSNARAVWIVMFTLINVIWATIYGEHWKRHSSELAYRWGTLDREPELFAEPHPRFLGVPVKNPQTGRIELEYPEWRRQLIRYGVSAPVILVCLATVCFALFQVLEMQTALRNLVAERNLPSIANTAFTLVFVGTIILSEKLYKPVAFYLNNLENYRLDEEYRNNLVLKLVLFHFIANYAALFYLAFYLKDRTRLYSNLIACFGTRQLLSLAQETAIPYALEKLRQFQLSYDVTQSEWRQLKPKVIQDQLTASCENDKLISTTEGTTLRKRGHTDAEPHEAGSKSSSEVNSTSSSLEGLEITQAEKETILAKYEDTYDDFLEMFIQFGYILMFTPVFPLAPVCALLNNIFEIRGDAFKLCTIFRRPFVKSVSNIGIWQDLFDVLIVIGIIVNCAGLYVSGDLQAVLRWSDTQTLVLIVILEHILIGIRVGLAYAIPDTPKWVATEISVLEHKRREALKKMEADRMEMEAKADEASVEKTAE